jgi:hypothetical protein
MIEAFVAFTKDHDIKELEKTLEAWALPGIEPAAIEVKGKKYELHRRVTAENLATGNYILVDIGYGPVEENFGELAIQELAKRKEVGLIGAWRTGQTHTGQPNSVVVCRKGVITHWPQPQSEFYIQEHVEAYRFAGYKTFLCSTLHYHQLNASLPC